MISRVKEMDSVYKINAKDMHEGMHVISPNKSELFQICENEKNIDLLSVTYLDH